MESESGVKSGETGGPWAIGAEEAPDLSTTLGVGANEAGKVAVPISGWVGCAGCRKRWSERGGASVNVSVSERA